MPQNDFGFYNSKGKWLVPLLEKKNQHMKPSAYKCFIPGEGQWHSSLLQKRLQCFAVVKVLLLPVNLLQHGIASVSWSV